MRYIFPIRLLVALLVSLGLAALLLLVLYATNLSFEVWDRLKEAPAWFMGIYVAALATLASGGAWLFWRLVFPRHREGEEEPPALPVPRTDREMDEKIQVAELAGVDVEAARQELTELQTRREIGEVYVALFGQVSTGKSSLVRALLPDATPVIDPRGGTTRDVTRYTWTSPAGDRLTLVDLPGLNEPDGYLGALAREEAQRAHVVIYLVDGDLTRDQHDELESLLAFGRPVILALNKADLYGAADLAQIRSRLGERIQDRGRIDVLTVSAATTREVVRVLPDGREETVLREVPPQVDALITALQQRIDADLDRLEHLRDASVFVLATRKLGDAVSTHRRERAESLVTEYSRKAVIGAMAAVAPGTDVLIQGYLGIQLVNKLCQVYEVPAREIDVKTFLDLAGGRVRKALPLFLAIAGNGLKAFPGIGTLTGGLLHAVAYGLIFDSLGRAVTQTLASRGALRTGPALRAFEETLSGDLEARTRRLAKLALDHIRSGGAKAPGD